MEWKNRKVLVNGAGGFIGYNLSRELLKQGAKVYSISRPIDVSKKPGIEKGFLEKIILIEGDVSKREIWKKVPKNIDYIFHFAAPSSVSFFKKEPERCFNETVFGLYHALEFAKENKVKKVVYPSTGNVYAGDESPHTESIYPKPKNLYGASKIACEALASSYSDFVDSIGLRISAGYGPGSEWRKDSLPFSFIKEIMEGKSPEIWGDGSQTRDFLYSEDLIKIILKSAEVDYTGIINVASGESITFRELIKKINGALGTKVEPIFIPKEVNYVENADLDVSLSKKILEIKPISLDEGLRKYINYIRASS